MKFPGNRLVFLVTSGPWWNSSAWARDQKPRIQRPEDDFPRVPLNAGRATLASYVTISTVRVALSPNRPQWKMKLVLSITTFEGFLFLMGRFSEQEGPEYTTT